MVVTNDSLATLADFWEAHDVASVSASQPKVHWKHRMRYGWCGGVSIIFLWKPKKKCVSKPFSICESKALKCKENYGQANVEIVFGESTGQSGESPYVKKARGGRGR